MRQVTVPAPPAINTILCVFDGVSGQPLTLLEGTQLTSYKCTAISAMVTDFCAEDNARVLAVIGSGVQAWQQVRAVMAVRAIHPTAPTWRISQTGSDNAGRVI